ncbi:MAG: (d)CMP kinase [Candidatus Eisenbacteria bacterium]|uniref:Cytidylate kinase n=1 Tax=Eiseniibacteriota bacterium TaxID=2212470 RepID=A0A538TWR2_UNCEI|nr:MAG: (d)CMP kinase [Candidatus Eisenbacteria bacterium]
MSFVVTIDGPAGAGKSTTARAVAARLGLLYVDTGALYRAFALKARHAGIPIDDDAALERCGRALDLVLSGSAEAPRVWLEGVDVSEEIRTPAVSELSSRLAARPVVRRRLVEIQRALRARGPLIAEGRDLGTVVFPDAEVKIYLDADLATRALRRHRELARRGMIVPLDEVRGEIASRDERDRSRVDSPLAAAQDAVRLDTSGKTVDEQVAAVLEIVRAHPAFPDPAGRAGRDGLDD